MLRVLIVDDEPVARRRMMRLLRAERDVDVIGEAGDGRAALQAIAEKGPDLVFLDVQIPELDGFGVLRALGGSARIPGVIFVTAFDRYALRAFEVHAIDYLLKPFTRERLSDAVARVRDAHQRDRPAADPRLAALLEELRNRPRFLERLPARAGARIVLVDTRDIDWIQAADNYVVLHAGGREYLIRETLTRLEGELDPHEFVRIHRSAMVRLDRIGELVPSPHGDFGVTLKNGAQLTLSRFYRDRVERALRRQL
jgi:two-component system LytT family response regulator